MYNSVNIWTVNAHTKSYGSYHNLETRDSGFYRGKGLYNLVLYTGFGAAVKHLYSPIFRDVRGTFWMGKLAPELLFEVKVEGTTIVNGTAKYEHFVHPILLFDDFIGYRSKGLIDCFQVHYTVFNVPFIW